MAEKKSSFTGFKRKRQTSARVLIADVLSKYIITIGGAGTIVAVMMVCIFLAAVVFPLFQSADASDRTSLEVKWGTPLRVQTDEYQMIGWSISDDGRLGVFRIDTGEVLRSEPIIEDRNITSSDFLADGSFVLGFEDGYFQVGRIEFETNFLETTDAPAELLTKLNADSAEAGGAKAVHEWETTEVGPEGDDVIVKHHGMVQLIPTGQLRGQSVKLSFAAKPRRLGAGPVRQIAMETHSSGAPYVAGIIETDEVEQKVRFVPSRIEKNLVTEKMTIRFLRALNVEGFEQLGQGDPSFIRLSNESSNIYVAWKDGQALRFRYNAGSAPALAQKLDFVADENVTMTALQFIIGNETLVAGHSDGTIEGWFTIPYDGKQDGFSIFFHDDKVFVFTAEQTELQEAFRKSGGLEESVTQPKGFQGSIDIVAADQLSLDRYLNAITPDGFKLVHAKSFPTQEGNPAVVSLSPSNRSRLVAAGFADGTAAVYQVTAERRVVAFDSGTKDPITHAVIGQKDDAFIAVTASGIHRWDVNLKHPGATSSTLFSKVWYEGYTEPIHMWQSSSADDASEPKLGLTPLIYGTIKATVYSMIFGAPLAILAAIFSSEFLKPSVRGKIKPGIEMMASLPSVVLGFLAAQLVAPWVGKNLAEVFTLFVTVPFCFLLAAYIWQMIPYRVSIRIRRFRFLAMFALATPLGIVVGLYLLGPLVELLFFNGDIQRYMHAAHLVPEPKGDSPIGGWMILFLPISGLLVAFISGRTVGPWMRNKAHGWTRGQTATYDFVRFMIGFLVVLVVALVMSLVFSGIMDPRSEYSFIDTYDPRNALVVGFIMGFAIIPIIYTIAEDALSAVPSHLRSASLGAGATPWQTAVRIVIPTAMSGLFSACMIGLGRAVGETMIVLMAAGNTPIMEANLLNGFRTLSANIATELPEAVENSTHYRTLFLAALVLFVITFFLNTIAETVRLRFRKRAYQL